SPLSTISREDIEFSGQPTLEEYLNQMPQVQPGYGRTSNNPGDGTAQINLRNLGPGRTLVMMNGRRLAPSGVGSAVDVNNLPSALVDRVEIITGGASTVYGSDAIAGVVNFITRDNFDGLTVEGSYYITEQGDSDIWDANLVWGNEFADGRGNVTLYAGLYEREALFASEREFTSVPYAEDIINGVINESGSTSTPEGVIFGPRFNLGSGPVQVTFNPDGTPRAFLNPADLWNFAPVNYLQIPLTRKTIGMLGHYEFTDHIEGYFEASYNLNEIKRNLAPAPLRATLVTNLDNPILTPETRAMLAAAQVSPGISRFSFGRRMLELGNRIFDTEREYQRIVGGVRGELFDGWDYDAWLIYTTADDEERVLNNGSTSRLQQGLLVDPLTGNCVNPSGGCVPVDVFGPGRLSPEAVDFIRWQPLINNTERNQYVASAVLTGSPLDIWTGPLDMAFGMEWRRDELRFEADPILFSGDVIGLGGDAPIDGTESVIEFYTEALMTLFESQSSVQKLDLEAGIRWSDYDLAGSVITWKAGLDWMVTESLRFRTMYQHAVRAPNNSELFTAQGVVSDFAILQNTVDPCSASADPVGNGNVDKCLAQGLNPSLVGVFEATRFYPTDFIFGGNPELVPESSDTFTIGMVITPTAVPDLTIAIDYYDLEVTDTIGSIDAQLVCFDDKNTAGLFCDRVRRDSTGNIYEIEDLFQNRGLLATSGIDFQAQYSLDLPDSLALFDEGAQLYVDAIWTHVFSLEEQANVATQVFECSGFFNFPCTSEVNPENRMTANFDYGTGSFTARLSWRWIDGMVSALPKVTADFGIPNAKLAIPEIGSQSYFDLGFSYLFGQYLSLRFGINNVADKEPVFMADAVTSNNTATSTYDIFGRSYYLGFSYNFAGN
ncbi:MAG TPA: TonB-dependent receptor, partial [Xanthomonadales bacterium]|nr:TonB-dependent receptor [Xanthomonadales bacterium]